MDTTTASKIPTGAFARGVALGEWAVRSAPSAKTGRINHFIEGKLLAGDLVLKVSEKVDQPPVNGLPKGGQSVVVELKGDYRKADVLEVGGHLVQVDGDGAKK
jgi:hypothetical protein